ncbi:MAG TPA: hypothetical protein VFE62_03535 [Gemmataceae bacterium]|nr:hypothetical protein [Gemmataceae bacterium]
MRKSLIAIPFVLIALCLQAHFVNGQEKKKKVVLPSTGWGSLKGKVTLDGDIPPMADLTGKMMIHVDKACCLDKKAKPEEKVDLTWVVDPKTKGIANVAVWIKAPEGTFFPIHEKLKVRKDEIVIDQPHCQYLPRVSAYQPFYFDGAKKVQTGQSLIIRNSAIVNHNVRVIGKPSLNPGFNVNMLPKTELKKTFLPQATPINLNCDIHTWMSAKLFVFDHPYYAITKADGTFEIPYVPAGAEVTIVGWHEGTGYTKVIREGEKVIIGDPITLKEGVNNFDITIKAPAK